jgi:hypothetical protein
MTWVRLDDQFAGHPKVEAVGPMASWLFVAALCHCATYLTDGLIIQSKAPRIAQVPKPSVQIAKLLAEGMWHAPGHGCETCSPCPDGHYLVHDYLHFQRSRAEVETERAAAAKRQKRARDRARESRGDDDESHGDSHGVTTPVSHGPPDPTRPDLVREPVVSSHQPLADPGGDDVVGQAIERWAQNELRTAKTKTSVVHDGRFLAAKRTEADRPTVARWLAERPTMTAGDLAACMANPSHLRNFPSAS